MLLTKEAKIQLSGKSMKYYKNLGYDGNFGDVITAKIEDLNTTSHFSIEATCDECGEHVTTRYANYCRVFDNYGTFLCKKCSSKIGVERAKLTSLNKYGVPHYSQTDEYIERRNNTCLEKYGVPNVFQVEEFQEKYKNTLLHKYNTVNVNELPKIRMKKEQTTFEHYGVSNPFQSKEVQQKIINTNLSKYGVKYNMQVPEIKNQAMVTNLLRYGVEHPLQSPEILAKAHKTMYENGTCPTSRQQQYIFDLYSQSDSSAELNYPVSHYSEDICFPEEKLVVEVDFGGHDLAVKIGKITQEEFNQKEIIRNNILKREGYKTMHITSTTDLLPSDTTLLQLLSYARQYFSEYPNHSWINFSIDTSQVFNAENKEGIFFNYGELHRLKQSA